MGLSANAEETIVGEGTAPARVIRHSPDSQLTVCNSSQDSMPSVPHYHVFSLPPELLQSLAPRNLALHHHNRPPSPVPKSAPSVAPALGSRACNVCLGTVFQDVDEQRSHYRSDWHRYNVKVRLSGGNSVTLPAFAHLIDGDSNTLLYWGVTRLMFG
jgi:hypothetical protein